jgi:hypothetical protein
MYKQQNSLVATISETNSVISTLPSTRPCNRLEQLLYFGCTVCKGSSPEAVAWVLQKETTFHFHIHICTSVWNSQDGKPLSAR